MDTADFIVVEFEDKYVNNLIFSCTSMTLLAILSCIGAPLIIHLQYSKLYEYMNPKHSEHSQFLVWAIVTIFILADHLLTWFPLFYHYVGWAQTEWNTRYQFVYWVTILFWSLVLAVDIPITAIIVYTGKKNDFPVPRLIIMLACFNKCCSGKRQNIFLQFVAVLHSIIAIQIFCFYSAVVFMALIARPVHTAILVIFFASFVFFLVTSLMLLFTATQAAIKDSDRIIWPKSCKDSF